MTKHAKKREDNLWSSNLRTLGRLDSNSDSDSDVDSSHPSSTQPGSAPVLSEDARLFKQLDLSARQDEAVYKPNPWTIAKMNAAARPLPPRREISAKSGHKSPAKEPPQGSIVEAFKKQCQKGLHASSSKCSGPTTRTTDNALSAGGEAHVMFKNASGGLIQYPVPALSHQNRPSVPSYSAASYISPIPRSTFQPKPAYTDIPGSGSDSTATISPAKQSTEQHLPQLDYHMDPSFNPVSARPEAKRLSRTTPGLLRDFNLNSSPRAFARYLLYVYVT